MKGEKINNLCKIIGIMNNDAVHMGDTLKIIDEDRVMIIVIESIDGSPVFGVADAGVVIDVKKILKMKIGAKEVLTPTFKGGKYILSNEDVDYQFVTAIPSDKIPHVPKLTNLNYIEVEKKALETFINQASDIRDYITLMAENGELHGYCDDCEVMVNRKLGKCDSALNIKSMYPTEYMKRWVKVAGSVVTLGLDTDYPMTAEWSDGFYKYMVMLAPRIEKND